MSPSANTKNIGIECAETSYENENGSIQLDSVWFGSTQCLHLLNLLEKTHFKFILITQTNQTR